MSKFTEIQETDMDRSANVIVDAWSGDELVSIDEMCEHLDALILVMEGKIDFLEFKEVTHLNGISWLH
jgi:hypothetical protein